MRICVASDIAGKDYECAQFLRARGEEKMNIYINIDISPVMLATRQRHQPARVRSRPHCDWPSGLVSRPFRWWFGRPGMAGDGRGGPARGACEGIFMRANATLISTCGVSHIHVTSQV